MRMLLVLAMVAMMVAPAARAKSPSPTTTQWALLTTAEAALFADGLQTLYISAHPPGVDASGRVPRLRFGYLEGNPLLGPTPSRGLVMAYFSSAMLATAGIWYAVPAARVMLPAAVIVLESVVVVRNGVLMRWRFGF
jgi:hypothetical protein